MSSGKALIGCVLIIVTTVGNFSVLLYYSGKERAWIFFTFSILDGKHPSTFFYRNFHFPYRLSTRGTHLARRYWYILVTWAVIIIHWLTNSPGEMCSRHHTSTETGLARTLTPEGVPPRGAYLQQSWEEVLQVVVSLLYGPRLVLVGVLLNGPSECSCFSEDNMADRNRLLYFVNYDRKLENSIEF